MRYARFLLVAAAVMLFTAGCESFRDGGDSGKSEKSSAEKSKKSGRKKSRGKRDPRDDMFFGLDGAKAKSFSNENLSEREQSLLNEELKRQDEEMRDMRRRHREMDSNRSQRKEWVYGFKPLGSDK